MHTAAAPFKHISGSKTAKIILVGEAFGKNEAVVGAPFVGWSGYELARCLHETGIVSEPPPEIKGYLNSTSLWYWWKRQTTVMTTNVFAFRPPDNKLEPLCAKREVVGKDYPLPALRPGQYVLPEYLPEIDRLATEIKEVNPNLVIALGGTASWAILLSTKIGSIRGSVMYSARPEGYKVLPTWHPANVLYQWKNRVILKADLLKANHESKFAEIRRPERYALVNPTLAEIIKWTAETLARAPSALAIDIETKWRRIECIGFAPSRGEALVIPFLDAQGNLYWKSEEDEIKAWQCVNLLCTSPIPKIFQNGLFDMQYLYKMRIYPRNCSDDTMLLHHSLYPELPKGLGFLGSIYSSESSWKLMRNRKDEELKREE